MRLDLGLHHLELSLDQLPLEALLRGRRRCHLRASFGLLLSAQHDFDDDAGEDQQEDEAHHPVAAALAVAVHFAGDRAVHLVGNDVFDFIAVRFPAPARSSRIGGETGGITTAPTAIDDHVGGSSGGERRRRGALLDANAVTVDDDLHRLAVALGMMRTPFSSRLTVLA